MPTWPTNIYFFTSATMNNHHGTVSGTASGAPVPFIFPWLLFSTALLVRSAVVQTRAVII